MGFSRVILPIMLGLAAPVVAGPIIVSPVADAVSVTVYRSQDSQSGDPIDLDDLQGYALITETRRISLPAGDATIRFEGIAGGIIPVSAVVIGLPGGVVQKNRDAQLLTPAALVNGSYGRVLHLKRTNRKTGKVTEENAELLAGPQGGIMLRTKAGIEALGCAGLPEALGHDGVPPGLTDKPTLSIHTRSKNAAEAVVSLTYLSNGFDWAASYVLRIGDTPGSFDLFAWLTLANGNAESFVQANTQAVAGKVNREEDPEDAEDPLPPKVSLSCWPMDITSTHRAYAWSRLPFYDGRTPRRQMIDYDGEEIIVSARRREERITDVPLAISALAAEMETLGDLKLYRIPEPVTVAANAQKQIALITNRSVKGSLTYGISTPFDYTVLTDEFDWQPMLRIIRFRNDSASGLGLPLPAGRLSLFDEASGQTIPLADETEDQGIAVRLEDTAVGQNSYFVAGTSTHALAKLERIKEQNYEPKEDNENFENIDYGDYKLTVSNANALPVTVEIPVMVNRHVKLKRPSERLVSRKGIKSWIVTLEPGAQREFTYRLEPNQ